MCFLSVSLPPCPVVTFAAFLQVISASAFTAPHFWHVSFLSWPEASCSKFPCRAGLTEYLSILYLFYHPCGFFQGSPIFQGWQRKICSSQTSLCFLVWIFTWAVPQTVWGCRMQEGYKVSVLFPARTNTANGFYKVPCDYRLDTGFKKWNLVRRDLIKMSKVTCIRRGLLGTPFLHASLESSKKSFREKLANTVIKYFTQLNHKACWHGMFWRLQTKVKNPSGSTEWASF